MSPVSNALYAQPPIPSPEDSQSSLETRFWGSAKTLGGVAETIAGGSLALGTSWSGIGGVAGGLVAAHGIDSSLSGMKQIYTGREERTYTAQGLTTASGSSTFGDIVDSAIGLFGSAGSALAKISKGFSKIRVPKLWKSRVWRFGELPYGVFGSTDPVGNIVIQRGLTGQDLKSTLNHELVHRFFSPAVGTWQKLRAQISAAGYGNSELLRFTEEAVAETYATGSPVAGILHPISNGYGITAKGLSAESTVVIGTSSNGALFGENLAGD